MTIQDILKKLKSNDERDELADDFVMKFNDTDKDNVGEFGTDIHMYKAGWNARDKQVEMLVKMVEKLRKQRNSYMTDVISWPTGTKTKLAECINQADKELLAIAEEFMEGE